MEKKRFNMDLDNIEELQGITELKDIVYSKHGSLYIRNNILRIRLRVNADKLSDVSPYVDRFMTDHHGEELIENISDPRLIIDYIYKNEMPKDEDYLKFIKLTLKWEIPDANMKAFWDVRIDDYKNTLWPIIYNLPQHMPDYVSEAIKRVYTYVKYKNGKNPHTINTSYNQELENSVEEGYAIVIERCCDKIRNLESKLKDLNKHPFHPYRETTENELFNL